jgi:hypothetical protein
MVVVELHNLFVRYYLLMSSNGLGIVVRCRYAVVFGEEQIDRLEGHSGGFGVEEIDERQERSIDDGKNLSVQYVNNAAKDRILTM